MAPDLNAPSVEPRVSCARITAEVPQFKPQWTLRPGIEELVGAYQRYGLRLADLTGPAHQRLGMIEQLRRAGRLDAALRWLPATHHS